MAAQQLSIFDVRPRLDAAAAQRGKRAGMAAAERSTSEAWRQAALAYVEPLLRRQREVTADELRQAIPLTPHSANCWGPFIAWLCRRGSLENTGRVRPSAQPQGHGNRIFVYRSRLYRSDPSSLDSNSTPIG